MTNKYIPFLLCLICFEACKFPTSKYAGSINVINIEAAIDNKQSFDLLNIAKDIDFITLDDTDKNSLIGNILEMHESRDRFYICDNYGKPVKVFDKTGKFLSTRGFIGRGPNELSRIGNIAVDYLNDNIYLGGGSSIVAYNDDGEFFARNDSILQVGAIACLNDKLIALKYSSVSKPEPGSKMTLLEIFSQELQRESGVDALDKGLTDIVTTNSNGMTFVRFLTGDIMSDNGKTMLVKETLNDTVFHYDVDKGLEPAYRLDWGDHSVPCGALGNAPEIQWSERFYSLNNIWEGEKYILAQAASYVGEFTPIANIILDKRDPSGGFTVAGADGKPGLFVDGIKFIPQYIRDNRLVGYIQSLDIMDNRDAITNPKLKALAATLKEDSNPVIVAVTLKK